jgi:hypothetical protein
MGGISGIITHARRVVLGFVFRGHRCDAILVDLIYANMYIHILGID